MTDSLTAHGRRVPKARVFVAAAIAAALIAAAVPMLQGSSPALGATPSCTPGCELAAANASFAQQVVTLVNQHRASLGLGALAVDATLTDAAVWKSRHMAQYGYFGHDDPAPPVARSPFTRMLNCGYSAGGSLARTSPPASTTPAAVMAGLGQLSRPSRELEAPSFRAIGVGVAIGGPYGIYWVQDFASGVVAAASAVAAPPPPAPPAPAAASSAARAPPPPPPPPTPPAPPPAPPAKPPPAAGFAAGPDRGSAGPAPRLWPQPAPPPIAADRHGRHPHPVRGHT